MSAIDARPQLLPARHASAAETIVPNHRTRAGAMKPASVFARANNPIGSLDIKRCSQSIRADSDSESPSGQNSDCSSRRRRSRQPPPGLWRVIGPLQGLQLGFHPLVICRVSKPK